MNDGITAVYEVLYHTFPDIEFNRNFKEPIGYVFVCKGFYSSNHFNGIETNFISLRSNNTCGSLLTYEGANPSKFVKEIWDTLVTFDQKWETFGEKMWIELNLSMSTDCFISLHPAIVLTNFVFDITEENNQFVLYEHTFKTPLKISESFDKERLLELISFCKSYHLLFI